MTFEVAHQAIPNVLDPSRALVGSRRPKPRFCTEADVRRQAVYAAGSKWPISFQRAREQDLSIGCLSGCHIMYGPARVAAVLEKLNVNGGAAADMRGCKYAQRWAFRAAARCTLGYDLHFGPGSRSQRQASLGSECANNAVAVETELIPGRQRVAQACHEGMTLRSNFAS